MRAASVFMAICWLVTPGGADGFAADEASDNKQKPVKELVPWLARIERGPGAHRARLAVGRELFLREWVPGDPRSHDGDGLGPVYNAASCVACHRLGGVGGAGPRSANVHIAVVALSNPRPGHVGYLTRENLILLHPGFRSSMSLVLHHQGIDPDYPTWRKNIKDLRAPNVTVTIRERNTPALFGVGLIDSIPEEEISAGVTVRHEGFPEVQGRTSRTAEGRIGRFGWKAQTPTLDEFVRTACAVEVGLEVPGHAQSPNPTTPNVRAPGLDLTEEQCEVLTDFVAALPAPGRVQQASRGSPAIVDEGERVFMSIGCGACHVPNLGKVEGIYSDLLLHDMGQSLSDEATYYASPSEGPRPTGELALATPAGPTEWRTPPLWGLRDSAPYLHDGRAPSIYEAIRLHGGEASPSASLFGKLTRVQRDSLLAFLKSLAAPAENPATKLASR